MTRSAHAGSSSRRLGDLAPASPRIPDHLITSNPGSTRVPAPHTDEEVRALVAMLSAAAASTICVGHGRHATSRATARAIADAWAGHGGTVVGSVDWPEHAASWLKPARRLVETQPDAWVIVDTPAGCAQLAGRLAEHESWSAARTFGTASLDTPYAAALSAFGVLDGMRGVTSRDASWRIGYGLLIHEAPIRLC
ncbi:MAG: ABC transporter substrate-binding protein [Antricoccus sp.]